MRGVNHSAPKTSADHRASTIFLNCDLVARQRQLLQVAVQCEDDRGGGRLVDLAALQVHDAVFDDVDPAEAVRATDLIEDRHEFGERQPLPVDRDGHARLEGDGEGRGDIRRLYGGMYQSQMSSGSSVSSVIPPEAMERHHIVLSSPPKITSWIGMP